MAVNVDQVKHRTVGSREPIGAQLLDSARSAVNLSGATIVFRLVKSPHLADFGLARGEAGEVTLTLDGQLLGTPAYMSPEQARGEAQQADPRSDLYSLGVVLFQMLTGELPFRGSTRMLIHQVIADEPPSPRKLNAPVPRDLETICLKCLEKEPDRRYDSARTLGEELDRFLRDEPIHGRPIGPVGRTWRWCRRKPVLAAMAGAVVALLLTVTAVSVGAAWRIATARKAEQRESYYAQIGLADHYIQRGDISRAKELLFNCPPEFRHWGWGPSSRCPSSRPSTASRGSTSPLEIGRVAQPDRADLQPRGGSPHRPAARGRARRGRRADAAVVGRPAGDDPAAVGDEPRDEDRHDVRRVLADRPVDDPLLEGPSPAASRAGCRERPDLGRSHGHYRQRADLSECLVLLAEEQIHQKDQQYPRAQDDRR